MSIYDSLFGCLDGLAPDATRDPTGNLRLLSIDEQVLLIEDFFVRQQQRLLDSFASDDKLRLKFSVATSNDIDILGRKALFYSDVTLIEIAEDHSTMLDAPTHYGGSAGGTFQAWVRPLNLVDVVLSLRPLIEAGRVVVVPRHRFWCQHNKETLKSHEPRLFDAAVNVHEALLEPQLYESLRDHQSSYAMRELKLPQLKQIPLHELLAFREHNGLQFETFHRELQRLLNQLRTTSDRSDELLLRRLMDEVDFHVRTLDEHIRKERRRSALLASYELGIAATGLVLYGILPAEFAAALTAAIGGATIRGALDKLLTPRSNDASPFYVAWKLHSQSSTRAPDCAE